MIVLVFVSCLLVVFFNYKEVVSKMCDFCFLINMFFIVMYELLFLYLLLYWIIIIVLDCVNGYWIFKGCFFCVVKILCFCLVISNSLYLLFCLGNCNKCFDKVIIFYLVNLVLFKKFFDKDVYLILFGDIIF